MKIFAIGDIHGGLRALIQLLNKLEVTESDTLIFLGDYVDGWSESSQVIQFLIELSERLNCVFIKGNHDVWCEKWLENGVVDSRWYMHGGKETLKSYEGVSEAEKKTHLDFFKKMPLYYIDSANRLFIHGGFTSVHGVEKERIKSTFYYDRTLWEMVLAMDNTLKKEALIYPKRLTHYKEIYIGHTPTINFKCEMPMHKANVWNIDTGAAFTGKLSAINIETKAIYQSENLLVLYPNEKGRNKTKF